MSCEFEQQLISSQDVDAYSETSVQMDISELSAPVQVCGGVGSLSFQNIEPLPSMNSTMTFIQPLLHNMQMVPQSSTSYIQHAYRPREQIMFPGYQSLQHTGLTTALHNGFQTQLQNGRQLLPQTQIFSVCAPGAVHNQSQIYGTMSPMLQAISYCHQPYQNSIQCPHSAMSSLPSTFTVPIVVHQKQTLQREQPGIQTAAVQASETMVANASKINATMSNALTQIRPKGKLALPYLNSNVPPTSSGMVTTQTQTSHVLSQTHTDSEPKSDVENQSSPNHKRTASSSATSPIKHKSVCGNQFSQLPTKFPVIRSCTESVLSTASPIHSISVANVTPKAITVVSSSGLTSSAMKRTASFVPVMTPVTSTNLLKSYSITDSKIADLQCEPKSLNSISNEQFIDVSKSKRKRYAPAEKKQLTPEKPSSNLLECVDVNDSNIKELMLNSDLPIKSIIIEKFSDTKVSKNKSCILQCGTKNFSIGETKLTSNIDNDTALIAANFMIQQNLPKDRNYEAKYSESDTVMLPVVNYYEEGKEKQPPKAIVKPQFITHVIDGFIIQEGPEPFPISCRIVDNQEVISTVEPDVEQNADESQIAVPKFHPIEIPDIKVEEIEVLCLETEFNPCPRKLPITWNVQEVFEFIRNFPDCSIYADIFRSQEIDGQALMLLKEDHLITAMHMKLGPALKLISYINSIKEEYLLNS